MDVREASKRRNRDAALRIFLTIKVRGGKKIKEPRPTDVGICLVSEGLKMKRRTMAYSGYGTLLD